MELGRKLLALRKAHNMTQEELAEVLQVSRQTIYKWETARALPDIARIKQICELFHVSSDELLEIVPAANDKTDVLPDEAPPIKTGAWLAKFLKAPVLWACFCAAVILACALFVIARTRQPEEVRQAISLGVVPAEMASGLSERVTERELLLLLSNVCKIENGGAIPALTAAASRATNEPLTRERAAYWIYCAHIWIKRDPSADLSIELDQPLISLRNVYGDLNAQSRLNVDGMAAPWEWGLCRELAQAGALYQAYDGMDKTNESINAILFGPYYTSVTFCLAQKSFLNAKPLMDCDGDSFCPKDQLTREEAITAAYRLYGSW